MPPSVHIFWTLIGRVTPPFPHFFSLSRDSDLLSTSVLRAPKQYEKTMFRSVNKKYLKFSNWGSLSQPDTFKSSGIMNFFCLSRFLITHMSIFLVQLPREQYIDAIVLLKLCFNLKCTPPRARKEGRATGWGLSASQGQIHHRRDWNNKTVVYLNSFNCQFKFFAFIVVLLGE